MGETIAMLHRRPCVLSRRLVLWIASLLRHVQESAKEQLRTNTDGAVALSVFGVPTFIVEVSGDIVFGNDRCGAWVGSGRGLGIWTN